MLAVARKKEMSASALMDALIDKRPCKAVATACQSLSPLF
jgi:hypothetical protein